jgi:hypothetical protein
MLRLGKIIEQYRYGRKHLFTYFRQVHFFQSYLGVPAVLLYFPKHLVALDHAGAARFMMLQSDELAIPELLKPVGYMLRHYVGVDINF